MSTWQVSHIATPAEIVNKSTENQTNSLVHNLSNSFTEDAVIFHVSEYALLFVTLLRKIESMLLMLKVLLLYCYLLTVFWLTLLISMPMQLKEFMLPLYCRDTLVANKILELMKYGKNNFNKFLNKFQAMEVSDFYIDLYTFFIFIHIIFRFIFSFKV